VDTGCIVAFEAGVDYDIQLAGGLKSMLFGGEGMFLATLEGHGRVWLQSLPFARVADRVKCYTSESRRSEMILKFLIRGTAVNVLWSYLRRLRWRLLHVKALVIERANPGSSSL